MLTDATKGFKDIAEIAGIKRENIPPNQGVLSEKWRVGGEFRKRPES
jgi:hypothetical protein